MSSTPNDIHPEDQPDDNARTEFVPPIPSEGDSDPQTVASEINADSDSANTELYSGSDSGSDSGSGRDSNAPSGSSGKTAGSDERVRREWEAALGSAGKGSGESIRFARQEASDSVLDRIAVRKVADANVDKTQRSNFDYAIQDKLGEGGMGIVFSANQTAVNRVVALKTLKKERNTDPGSQKQFFYEAELTADLDHPNIPPIYELGMTEQGTFFYTMKLIKGSEWHRVMSKRSSEENLEIFEKVADAVGFAHSKKIINLDIKPQNVILGGYGEVYVTDWGMAHSLDTKIAPSLGGTPDYMAPEIPRKALDKVGPQTDIYLLGAVLFQMITGNPPHAGVETKDRKRAAHAKVMDAYHNKIRPTDSDNPLLQVALKAMSTDPADRYATVEDMQAAVREIVKENANIKTSLELTKSSKSTLQLAEKSQNYERFNSAIYGFRNAVGLWTGNKEAEEELAKARLAFAKCAFTKGDFDLALQTLDRKVPDEATLFDKAQKAKTAVLNRESRFKALRNAVFGLLALGGIGATGAAVWINRERSEAVKQRGIAEEKTQEAITNLNEANTQRGIAEEKTKEALTNLNEANAQRGIAEEKTKEALTNLNEANTQRSIADEKTKEALTNLNEANTQRGIADEKTKEALARLAQITVGDKLTNLGFASAQTDKANPIGAATLLDAAQQVDEQTKQAFGEKPVPQLVNWASRRVELLSNRDLKPAELDGKVTAIDFAKGRNLGVAGLSDGRVVVLELKDGRLIKRWSTKIGENKTVVAASISPNAEEALLAVADPTGTGAKLYRWGLEGEVEPMQEETTKRRFFQRFAYSPDGAKVVAGIRGGIWIKNKGADWVNLTPLVKGVLLDIDWIDHQSMLILAEAGEDHNLYSVGLSDSAGSEPNVKVVASESLGRTNKPTQLGFLGGNQWMVATEGGGLSIFSFDPSASALKDSRALPKQHRSTVTQIDVDPSGRIVTGSREAVAHVWRFEPKTGQVAYDTFVAGTPGGTSKDNLIERTTLVDDRYLVSVDTVGAAVALDIDRQKQRREMSRDPYERVVIGIHPVGGSEVLSVDESGAVDRWDLNTGRTIPLISQNQVAVASRFSYFGHTPGAVLFDTAIDAQRGVVVTSAVLPRNATRYAPISSTRGVSEGQTSEEDGKDKSWAEFCVWDQSTGNMLRRWQTAMIGTVEPRLTLLEDGTFHVGNESRTYVFDYRGQDLFVGSREKSSATFAVVHPARPEWVAMLRRSGGKGQMWLWNRGSGDGPELKTDALIEENMPVHAAWSADGRRLYVLDMAGNVIPYTLQENRLVRTQSTVAKLEGTAILNALRSYQDVELAVRSQSTGDSVLVNVRQRSPDGDRTTTFTSMYTVEGESIRDASKPISEDQPKLLWLTLHPNHRVEPAPQVLSKRLAGNQVFVSMKNGRVYGLSEKGGTPILYGRKELVMSTSDRQGNRLMLLNEDGSLHVMNVSQGSDLKLTTYRLENGERRIELSPDGQQLAAFDETQKTLRVLASESGQVVREIPNVVEFEWDPEQGASLATLEADGSLKIEADGKAQTIRNLNEALGARRPSRLGFFRETWADEKQAPVRYVVLQVEDKVLFVPREEDAENFEETLGSGLKLAVSPTDSLLATGDSTGTIRIWFASPTNKICRQVYDVDRQDMAEVTRIAFSGDGDTLITSDARKRVSAWMSRDKRSSGE